MMTEKDGKDGEGGLDKSKGSKLIFGCVEYFLYIVGVVFGLAITPLFTDPGGLWWYILVFLVFPSVLEIPYWVAIRRGWRWD